MRRSNVTLFVLLAVGALGALFLTLDPLGLLGASRETATGGAGGELTAEGPHLEGAARQPKRLPTRVNGEPVGVLTLTLGDASLEGTVTGQGQPLPLARVQPVLPPPFPGLGVHTDEKGRWAIRGLPAGTFELRATAEGFRGLTTTAPPLGARDTKEVPPIDLARRTERLDGLLVKVTDLEGKPIGGARVVATTMPWDVDLAIGPVNAGFPGVVHREVPTDAKGEALFEGLPPAGYDVVGMAKGRVATAVKGVQVARGRLERMTLRLGPGVSIQGVVVTSEGKPVADAFVFGLHQPSWVSCVAVRTAADGTYTLDGLREGTYMLIAGADDVGSAVRNGVASPSTGVRLEVKGAGRLEGTVTGSDGKPVTSFRVRPAGSQIFGYQFSRVYEVNAPDGKFGMNVAAAPYELRVTTPDGNVAKVENVKVEGGKTTTVDVVMRVTGVVKGVVTDPSGQHVEGAEVYVNRGGMPGGPEREHYARTDADGHFEVQGLALEDVTLHVRHARWADTTWTGKAAVAAQAPEVTIRLEGGARVVGRVARGDGAPAAGERVNLYQSWFEPRTQFCDGEGRFAFDHVAAGKWSVQLGVFENGATGLSRNGIDVPASGDVTVDFAYEAGQGSVTGTITMGGKPVVGATVSVGEDQAGGAGRSVTTDAQGAFKVEGLAVGRVQVYVETAQGLTGSRRVAIDPQTRTASVTFEFGTAAVRGRLEAADHGTIGNAWITAERADPSSASGFEAVSNKPVGEDLGFEMKGLLPGTYHLRIWAGGYAQITTDPFTLAEGESRDQGTIVVPRGADLSGRVTDDAGQPVENATISVKDLAGKPLFSFSLYTTGSDGRYTVQGLLTGRYLVGAEARGHGPAQREVAVGSEGASLDLVVSRGGTLKARVVDAGGKPIGDARVVLLDAKGERVTRTWSLVNWFEGGRDHTNAEGEATIPDLAVGTYRVKAEKEGLTVVGEEASVAVTPGGTATATLTLGPAK